MVSNVHVHIQSAIVVRGVFDLKLSAMLTYSNYKFLWSDFHFSKVSQIMKFENSERSMYEFE